MPPQLRMVCDLRKNVAGTGSCVHDGAGDYLGLVDDARAGHGFGMYT